MQNRPSVAIPQAAPTLPVPSRRFIVVALMMVMVLASMEQTITATAMPTIIGDLHGFEHYSWVASIYLLACTVSMPLYGRLSDAFGRKRVILSAIAIFCAASLAAASSRTMGQLILFRGLQGLGAGGIMPVALTILGDIFTIEERARIQGFFSAVWGTAALAGPALGALLVNTLGWRSIFYVNLPLGLVALGMLMWKYHDREKPHSSEIDFPGAVLLTMACSGLLALASGATGSWPMSWSIGLGVVTLASAGAFVWHERRTASPLLPPDLILRRDILPPLLASMLIGLAFLSLEVYVPMYVQGARGGGAVAAASVITPIMLTWALSAFLSAPLVIRLGFRKTSIIGAAVVSTGLCGLLLSAVFHLPHWAITSVLALTGFGFGPASMALLLAAQDAVVWQQRGVVTAAVTFFRTMGGAVGIGLLGGLFNLLAMPRLRAIPEVGDKAASLFDPQHTQALSPAATVASQRIIGDSLIWVFVAMFASAVILLLVSFFVTNRKSQDVSSTEAFEAAMG